MGKAARRARRATPRQAPAGDLVQGELVDGTACKVCRLILNRFTYRDGRIEWRHARPWIQHDHEPVPVPANTVDFIETCDFCPSTNRATARYVGEEIHDFRDDAGDRHNFSAEWAACRRCDELIQRNDLDGLADRTTHLAKRRLGGNPPPELVARRREAMLHLWRTFLPTVHTRHVRQPAVDPDRPRPTPLAPTRLPKVRDALARYWRERMPALLPARHGQGIAVPAEDVDLDGFAHYTHDISAEHATRFCHRIGNTLHRAAMLWVSPEFTDLVLTTAAALRDVLIIEADLPARHGLLVWARPVMTVPGPVGDVVAVSWHTVPHGVWIIGYTQAEQSLALANPGHEIDLQQLRADVGWLLPTAPGGGAAFEQPIDLTDGGDDARRLMAVVSVTWLIRANQKVTEESDVELDRKDRKAYVRNNPGRTPPTVRLVDLRRRPRKATGPTNGDKAPRTYRWQWWVTGFTRDQWWGPGRSRKRRVYIAPHLAGPDHLPIKPRTSVVEVLR